MSTDFIPRFVAHVAAGRAPAGGGVGSRWGLDPLVTRPALPRPRGVRGPAGQGRGMDARRTDPRSPWD